MWIILRHLLVGRRSLAQALAFMVDPAGYHGEQIDRIIIESRYRESLK